MLNHKQAHLLIKAQKERGRKNFKECIRLCQSVLKASPDTTEAHEILGLAALDSHDFFTAETAGREVMRLQPLNPNGALITSVSLMSRAMDNAAIEVLKLYLKLQYDLKRDYRIPGSMSIGNYYGE